MAQTIDVALGRIRRSTPETAGRMTENTTGHISAYVIQSHLKQRETSARGRKTHGSLENTENRDKDAYGQPAEFCGDDDEDQFAFLGDFVLFPKSRDSTEERDLWNEFESDARPGGTPHTCAGVPLFNDGFLGDEGLEYNDHASCCSLILQGATSDYFSDSNDASVEDNHRYSEGRDLGSAKIGGATRAQSRTGQAAARPSGDILPRKRQHSQRIGSHKDLTKVSAKVMSRGPEIKSYHVAVWPSRP